MSTKLNKRQQIAAQLLGTGLRPSEVAKKVGTSRETISRWQNLPKFLEEIEDASTATLGAIIEERFRIFDLSHQVLKDALANSDLNSTAKANIALRCLEGLGSKNSAYDQIMFRWTSRLCKKRESDPL